MFILILFFSCTEKPFFDPNIPTVNQELLSNVLADLHMMEVHINQSGINLVTYKDSLLFFKTIVLQKHGVNEKDFQHSLSYYAQFPENYKTLYDKVKEKLLEIELQIPDVDEDRNRFESTTNSTNIK